MKTFSLQLMVLLNGPVQNALFCLMDRYRMFAFGSWQGSAGFKGWNSRLPTWEPQRTIARNCRFPQVRSHGSQPGNQRLPLQATRRYQRLELMLPTWEPQATIAKNFRFLKVGTHGSQRGNQRLPWQGTAGSQTLKLAVPNLGTRGYHCNELPVPRS